MHKKTVMIIFIVIIIVISLIISIYMPNKKKIEGGTEDKSVSYKTLEDNGKVGIIDGDGNTIIQPQYEEVIIVNPYKAVFICINGENRKIVNNKNKEILTQYNNLQEIKLKNIISESSYEKNVLTYEENSKYGLVDLDGNIVVKAKYDEISSLGYKEGEILIKEKDKYGLIDDKGKQIIKSSYDDIKSDKYYNSEIGYKKSGYIVCTITNEGYRYGYYDYQGEKVLETEYNDIMRIRELKDSNSIYLIAAKNGQYGVFINNAKIINTQYQSISYDDTMEIFIVERTGQFGAIDSKGVEILKTQYENIEIKGIYMYTQKGEEQKVFDSTGKEKDIPFTTRIEKTSNTRYYIKIEEDKQEGYSILNSNFEEISQEKYQYLEYAFDNYFIASNINGNEGIIDDKGNIIIEFNYDSIQTIKDKKIVQVRNFETEITQIYNSKLEKVIEMSDINIQSFDDYVKIYNDTEEYYLDNNGNQVINQNT